VKPPSTEMDVGVAGKAAAAICDEISWVRNAAGQDDFRNRRMCFDGLRWVRSQQ
jgi:hypothetical protein